MLGLLGLLGAVVAGLAFDSGSDPREDEHEPQDTPEGEAWGVSAAYLGFGADEDSGTDHGGTEPDGQPISNDTPTPIDPDRDMTGTAGVFGSAAAGGRLLGLDAPTMAVAFGLAGTQAGGLRETFGTMTKAFHPARAAQSGLLAALMAQRGFSSTARILEGPHGFAQAFAAGAFDPAAIVDGLGERWLLMDNAPKPYASAILSHPMVDAMLALRAQPGVSPAQVVRIGGRVNPLAIRLESRPEPADGLAARLSFQHAMAAAFVDGACLPAQFTDARVHDPVVAGVRRLIEMAPDPAMPQHGCEVELSLADGRVLRQTIEHATGSPGRPVSDVQLEAKFLALAGTVLPAARARRLLDQLWQVDGLPDVGVLLRACRRSPRLLR